MIGKKCALCGEKLNLYGVCTECGLNNKERDKNDRINESDCEGKPLTHKHKEKEKIEPLKQRSDRAKTSIAVLTIAVTILGVAVSIWNSFTDNKEQERQTAYQATPDGGRRYDPYEFVEEELPETGETVTYSLPSGMYIVGADIPAGKYVAKTENEFDSVRIADAKRRIYLFETQGSTTQKMEDMRFYPGAFVEIKSQSNVQLDSQNAQVQGMRNEANPLTESVSFTGETRAVAGEDFPAGVYDIQKEQGNFGSLAMFIGESEGQSQKQIYLYLENAQEGVVYKNAVLPYGSVIECDSNVVVKLVPSERIVTIDYRMYYQEMQ